MRRCLRDPTFSRFDTIPECDRQHTHTATQQRHIPRLARSRAVKIKLRDLYNIDNYYYSTSLLFPQPQ